MPAQPCAEELLENRSQSDSIRGSREWAARHVNMPGDFLDLLERAGSSREPLGSVPPDSALEPLELESIARLGPRAARIVARHPNTAAGTLARLAEAEDTVLRATAAAHPNTPSDSLTRWPTTESPRSASRPPISGLRPGCKQTTAGPGFEAASPCGRGFSSSDAAATSPPIAEPARIVHPHRFRIHLPSSTERRWQTEPRPRPLPVLRPGPCSAPES